MIRDPGGKQRSTWRPHRACLEAIPEDATHALILQDDAWPCERFPEVVRAAIQEKPDRIICLFVSGSGPIARKVNLARVKGDRWIEFPTISYIPLVAVIYPAAIAREIPVFADSRRTPIGRADDAVVGAFARAHRISAVAILPSLVEHRDEVQSVMLMPSGNRSPHRLAAWYQENPLPTSGVIV